MLKTVSAVLCLQNSGPSLWNKTETVIMLNRPVRPLLLLRRCYVCYTTSHVCTPHQRTRAEVETKGAQLKNYNVQNSEDIINGAVVACIEA